MGDADIPRNGEHVQCQHPCRDRWRKGTVIGVGALEVAVRWYIHGPMYSAHEFYVCPVDVFWRRFTRDGASNG